MNAAVRGNERSWAIELKRLIGLWYRDEYPDEALNHALRNFMFTMCYIEASGFGRGLGCWT